MNSGNGSFSTTKPSKWRSRAPSRRPAIPSWKRFPPSPTNQDAAAGISSWAWRWMKPASSQPTESRVSKTRTRSRRNWQPDAERRLTSLRSASSRANTRALASSVGAINNAGYRDLTRVETLVASGHLRKLRDAGLLAQKGKSAGTYYVPTPRLLTKPTELQGLPTVSTPALSQQSMGLTPSTRAQPTGFKGNLQGSSTELTPAPTTQAQGLVELPQPLQDVILRLGQRAAPAEVRGVIAKLCAWQPLKAEQISRYLKRQQLYVTRTHLTPMVRDGQLQYLYPDQPAHPQQAYRTQTKPSDQNRH